MDTNEITEVLSIDIVLEACMKGTESSGQPHPGRDLYFSQENCIFLARWIYPVAAAVLCLLILTL